MKFSGLSTFKMLGVVALATSLVSIWPGCKGSSASTNTTSSATGPTYVTSIYAAPVNTAHLLAADPLTSPVWQAIAWRRLTAAPGHSHLYGQTRVATAFHGDSLYAAFICSGDDVWYNSHTSSAALWKHDSVELWLDTSKQQNGTNFLEIVVAPDGKTYECWHRAAESPQPLHNGKINFTHPFSLIPWKTPGLAVHSGHANWRGEPVWTLVIKVPLANLPRPMSVKPVGPTVGLKFRINFIRNDWHLADGKRRLIQYNLFPVATGTQAFAPYRMGEVVVGSGQAIINLAMQADGSASHSLR